jgi:hypothetical protein
VSSRPGSYRGEPYEEDTRVVRALDSTASRLDETRFGRCIRWVGNLLSEAVGELAALGVACLILVAVVAALGWGLSQAPTVTVVLAACLVAFLAYGAYEVFRGLRVGSRAEAGSLRLQLRSP